MSVRYADRVQTDVASEDAYVYFVGTLLKVDLTGEYFTYMLCLDREFIKCTMGGLLYGK